MPKTRKNGLGLANCLRSLVMAPVPCGETANQENGRTVNTPLLCEPAQKMSRQKASKKNNPAAARVQE
jgi:hypothetical protein